MTFVEFKRVGETPTKIQDHHLLKLSRMGHRTAVVSLLWQFMDLLTT